MMGKPVKTHFKGEPPTGFKEREPGDIYYAFHGWHKRGCVQWSNCEGHQDHLIVTLPDGSTWDINGRAHNCTKPKDKTHRCWVRHGTADNLTIDKDGETCGAGSGSIQSGSWHGWLRNGWLEEV